MVSTDVSQMTQEEFRQRYSTEESHEAYAKGNYITSYETVNGVAPQVNPSKSFVGIIGALEQTFKYLAYQNPSSAIYIDINPDEVDKFEIFRELFKSASLDSFIDGISAGFLDWYDICGCQDIAKAIPLDKGLPVVYRYAKLLESKLEDNGRIALYAERMGLTPEKIEIYRRIVRNSPDIILRNMLIPAAFREKNFLTDPTSYERVRDVLKSAKAFQGDITGKGMEALKCIMSDVGVVYLSNLVGPDENGLRILDGKQEKQLAGGLRSICSPHAQIICGMQTEVMPIDAFLAQYE